MEDYVEKSGMTGSELHMAIFDRQLIYYQDDNLYFQYQQGLLSEEFWIGVRNGIVERLTNDPLGRAVYENRTITRELDQVIAEILTEIDEN